jgi:hypothetical protein
MRGVNGRGNGGTETSRQAVRLGTQSPRGGHTGHLPAVAQHYQGFKYGNGSPKTVKITKIDSSSNFKFLDDFDWKPVGIISLSVSKSINRYKFKFLKKP